MELEKFIGKITELIIQPAILLMFAVAMYYFTSGIAGFVLSSDNPEERKKGRSKLIWGLIGFFIMSSVTAILYIITNTFCGVPFCGVPGIQQTGKF